MSFLAPVVAAMGGWSTIGTVVSVAATVGQGIMAYQGAQQQAKASRQAAFMYQQQAAQANRLAALREQGVLAHQQVDEIASQEERIALRRNAYMAQQEAIAQAAGRGYVAAPFGSLGAVMISGEEQLYKDVEANRAERMYKSTMYALELAGIWESAASNQMVSMIQAQTAAATGRAARVQGWVSLLDAGIKTYSLLPSEVAPAQAGATG